MTKIFGYLLKGMSTAAVIGIIILAIAVEAYAFVDMYEAISTMFEGYNEEDEIIKKCLKSLDLVLLGVIFFSIGIGLFELYVGKIKNIPSCLVIDDLDSLKALMIKMVIVVMTISFTGRVVTYSGGLEILYLGGGLAVVIAALTFFLANKNET
ncbi:MAG: YqhA family protein [Nonlabens sp.]